MNGLKFKKIKKNYKKLNFKKQTPFKQTLKPQILHALYFFAKMPCFIIIKGKFDKPNFDKFIDKNRKFFHINPSFFATLKKTPYRVKGILYAH